MRLLLALTTNLKARLLLFFLFLSFSHTHSRKYSRFLSVYIQPPKVLVGATNRMYLLNPFTVDNHWRANVRGGWIINRLTNILFHSTECFNWVPVLILRTVTYWLQVNTSSADFSQRYYPRMSTAGPPALWTTFVCVWKCFGVSYLTDRSHCNQHNGLTVQSGDNVDFLHPTHLPWDFRAELLQRDDLRRDHFYDAVRHRW